MTEWLLLRRTRVRRVSVAWLTLFAISGLWSTALAQDSQPSLVELARQEQARRKAIKAPGKVYTDKELKVAAPASPASGRPVPDATVVPDSPAIPGTPPVEPESGHDQTWWANRMMAAREELRRNEAFAEALQSRINALTTDYTNRDDPYQRAKLGEDRQKAVAELNRLKGEIENAKKAIALVEEEARTSGVPPGWIR